MLRRDLFLGLGGYRGSLFRQGEEKDFCIRLLDAGYVVRLGDAAPLHHLESTKRSTSRNWQWTGRNAVLFAWQNVPTPEVIGHLFATTVNILRHGVAAGAGRFVLTGLLEGYRGIRGEHGERRPVSHRTYRISRMLVRREAVRLSELESMLPPLRSVPASG
jgi:GT2 family glycosyltransferase